MPSIAVVYATRLWLVPVMPDEVITIGSFVITKAIALMLLFAVVMILVSVSMIRPESNTVVKDRDDLATSESSSPAYLSNWKMREW